MGAALKAKYGLAGTPVCTDQSPCSSPGNLGSPSGTPPSPFAPPGMATPTQTFIDNPQYTTIRYVQIYNGIEYICVPLIDDNAADSYTECSP
jgi:hypothetical protein